MWAMQYNTQIKFLALFFGIPEWFCGLAYRGMTKSGMTV